MLIANLATYPPRLDALLETSRVISQQVDTLNVILNEYTEVPKALASMPNVNPIIPPHDTKDTGKFFPEISKDDTVVLVDDDLDYPIDYVQQSLDNMAKIPHASFVAGYHGTVYKKPGFSFGPRSFKRWLLFRGNNIKFKETEKFYEALSKPRIVGQLGTGTVFLRGIDQPPFEYMANSSKYVDIRFAKWCFDKQLPMVCLPRDDGWIKEIHFDETIYETFTLKAPKAVTQELQTFALNVPNQGTYLDI